MILSELLFMSVFLFVVAEKSTPKQTETPSTTVRICEYLLDLNCKFLVVGSFLVEYIYFDDEYCPVYSFSNDNRQARR